jgi:twitching motility protein PilT
VAVLDKYLEAMSKQNAEAVLFTTNKAVEMMQHGEARPISSRPANHDQLVSLMGEVLGSDFLAKVASGHGSFNYKGPYGAVAIQITEVAGGIAIKVQPAAAGRTASVPPPAAVSAPAATHAPVVASSIAVSEGAMPTHMDDLFNQMLDMKASDLHLKSDKVPMARVDGSMVVVPGRPPLSSEVLQQLISSIIPERNAKEFAEVNDSDFAYEMDRARMRCNVFRDLAGVGAVFRQIPTKILSAQQLNLPPAVMSFCQFDKGLVVVTGPTGSGKSTTLAAMVDWINENRDDHLITIEDPVEFVHKDKKCHINQREVGPHTKGFKSALRAALREDPDIVLVGEMRDLETVAIAIETAETGHLVFGTLHTNTAASTIDRLIDQFPTDRQPQVRAMLSESLRGVVAQTLLKKKGGGRVAALEILVVNNAVANLIREGKTF